MSSARPIMDVYIIHDSSLDKRAGNVNHIEEMLSKSIFVDNIKIIDQFNAKDLTAQNIQNLIRVKKPENMDPVEKKFEKFQKAITLANISNYLKHFNAIEQVVRRNVPAIIVEDDVIMAQDCDKLLNDIEIFEHDVVMFGQPFASTPKSKFTKMANFESDLVLLPSCESYFISTHAANKILKNLLPIAYNTNIALSLNFSRSDLHVYKAFPNMFIDGSKVGKYTSSLNNNNTLLYHSSYNKLYAMVQGSDSDFDESLFDAEFERAEYNECPDMLYLKGLSLIKVNKLVEAKRVFDIAYEKYCEDGCALNKSSSFMGNYINFYRVLQN